MRNSAALLRLVSITFVVFTSVHCEKNYTCVGRVLDATTQEPIDSVTVLNPSETVYTSTNGSFELNNFKTYKRPSIKIVKEGYGTQEFKDCRKINTILLEH